MLSVVGKKSLIGKALEEHDVSRQAVSEACGGVAFETISKWCNLDEKGKPRQNISQEHLMQLVTLIKQEANVSIDPTDLLETPDYYVNQLRVVGSFDVKGKIQIYPRHKKIKVDTKFPPDRSAFEFQVNSDKVYFFVFDSIEFKPETRNLHNIDAFLKLKDGTYVFAQDIELGFDNAIRFTNMALSRQKDLFNMSLDDIECYHPITDLKVKIL